jgi:hypothetical protein
MANPEHLEILNQGVEVWNKWRQEKTSVKPDLKYTNFNVEDSFSIHFDGIDLSDSDLALSNLSSVTFNNAIFRNANLFGANLSYTWIDGSDLSYATLIRANLCFVRAHQTIFNGAKFGNTMFGSSLLTDTKGLDSCEHMSFSPIDYRTLLYSDKLPLPFLRGCGLPDTFIEYIPSLLDDPLQFYKCFISFTEADDLFSERLYNDLQGAGVRCWRWKEDAKWGKTLMRSIDEAVRIYDKLIVICSEQSLNSPAVIREIERALQKEDELARQGKEAEVLFPIRLNDYIFTGWNHHRKADVIAKNVGDFRSWNEPEQYKKAFDRLLRDLKATE